MARTRSRGIRVMCELGPAAFATMLHGYAAGYSGHPWPEREPPGSTWAFSFRHGAVDRRAGLPFLSITSLFAWHLRDKHGNPFDLVIGG
jgi:hypothetical protein